MLAFLLDIVEVAEVHHSYTVPSLPVINVNIFLQSHIGFTMAKAFQEMLVQFGLEEKVCLLL